MTSEYCKLLTKNKWPAFVRIPAKSALVPDDYERPKIFGYEWSLAWFRFLMLTERSQNVSPSKFYRDHMVWYQMLWSFSWQTNFLWSIKSSSPNSDISTFRLTSSSTLRMVRWLCSDLSGLSASFCNVLVCWSNGFLSNGLDYALMISGGTPYISWEGESQSMLPHCPFGIEL